MNFKSFCKRVVAQGISEVNVFRPRDLSGRILMYHSIGGDCIDDSMSLCSISAERFCGHMKHLIDEHQCKFCSLEEILVRSNETNLISLTFDDGYADNLKTALPILERFEIPATIFVSAAFIKKRDQRFLSLADLRFLAEHPLISIGAHGFEHVKLAECGEEQITLELNASKFFLEDVTGDTVKFLSYPNGSFNDSVKLIAKQVGYKAGFTSRMGSVRKGRDAFEVSRVSVLSIDSNHTLKRKVQGAWDWHGDFFMKNLDDV